MGLFGLSPFPDITDLFGGKNPFHSGGVHASDSDWIKNLMDPAFGEVNKGTATAADLLQTAYEGQFRSRLGGLVSGYQDQASHLGAQGASQGLSPDVVQRMLTGQGAELQGQIGQARGDAQFGLNSDLAKLYKGTGSELAGLYTDEAAIRANYIAALKGAKAAKEAGIVSGIGGLIGGVIGAA